MGKEKLGKAKRGPTKSIGAHEQGVLVSQQRMGEILRKGKKNLTPAQNAELERLGKSGAMQMDWAARMIRSMKDVEKQAGVKPGRLQRVARSIERPGNTVKDIQGQIKDVGALQNKLITARSKALDSKGGLTITHEELRRKNPELAGFIEKSKIVIDYLADRSVELHDALQKRKADK